jgi:starch synthase
MSGALPELFWFVSREYGGIAEAGGVKSVVRALCEELAKRGCRVTALVPLYAFADRSAVENYCASAETYPVQMGDKTYPVSFASGVFHEVEIVFVAHELFRSRRAVYTYTAEDEQENPAHRRGTGFHDVQLINVLFQKAALAYGLASGAVPRLVHCHDAPTALLPALARENPQFRAHFAPTAFTVTIHNAGPAYHHEFYALGEAAHLTGISGETLGKSLNGNRVEPYLLASFYAHLTTVSPWYAEELSRVQQPDNSDGLSACFSRLGTHITGITNGIDAESYDTTKPEVSLLPYSFDPAGNDFGGKYQCRDYLLQLLSSADKPDAYFAGVDRFGTLGAADGTGVLVAYHGRIVHQKGIDVLLRTIELLLSRGAPLSFAVHGQGESVFENWLIALAERFPGKCAYCRGYNKRLARLCTAAADFLALPSAFEPCGLEDFIGQLFGTISVAHATGGLQKILDTETGFLYRDNTPEALSGLLASLADGFRADRAAYARIAVRAARYVREEYSWSRIVSEHYVPFYRCVLEDLTRAP